MILFRAFSAFAVVGTGYLGRCPRLLHCAPSALKLARTSGNQHEECSQRLSVCVGNILSPARGTTGIVVRADRMIVSTPLPTRARERMRLFDQMAEIGTRPLLETDEYIILSSR